MKLSKLKNELSNDIEDIILYLNILYLSSLCGKLYINYSNNGVFKKELNYLRKKYDTDIDIFNPNIELLSKMVYSGIIDVSDDQKSIKINDNGINFLMDYYNI